MLPSRLRTSSKSVTTNVSCFTDRRMLEEATLGDKDISGSLERRISTWYRGSFRTCGADSGKDKFKAKMLGTLFPTYTLLCTHTK